MRREDIEGAIQSLKSLIGQTYRRDGSNKLLDPLNCSGLITFIQGLTPQSAEPASPTADDVYLDDGTNTASGSPGWRYYNGSSWDDVGARGEANTASNVGVGGYGIFKQKTGVDLEFYNIISGTGIAIAPTANDEYEFASNDGQIDHDVLLNFVATEHVAEASIDHGTIAGLADDDHESYPPVYVSGSLRSNPLIMAGAQAIDGSNVAVTLPAAYTGTGTYVPFAIVRGSATTPYVTQVIATSSSQFTIYLSASLTGTIYWFTVGY